MSTSTNAVHWLSADGLPLRHAQFAEAVDAWHLNCPAVDHAGRLVVTAFAQVDAEQGWRPLLRAGERSGVLVDAVDGTVRFGGLRGPHDPLALADGTWLVNDSGSGRLLHVADDGTVIRFADLGGWTRGLVLSDDRAHAYVGVSSRRHEGEAGRAEVIRLELATLAAEARWPLESDEVFSLVWVDDALRSGLRRGFGAMPGAAASRPT